MKKTITIISLIISLTIISCQGQVREGDPSSRSGLISALRGLGHLVLSPFQIAAGLLEGVASLPYYAATSLRSINDGLVKAQAKVSLDDTYKSAYGKRLTNVSDSGDTGQSFRRMKHATVYFQKVLKEYGIRNSQSYILTSIDTATRNGYTLFAVVYRQPKSITVLDKEDKKTVRRYTVRDRLFYEPFRVDINGRPLDRIIDFAGIPVQHYRTQKMQAILLTLAANSVINKKQRSEYWNLEQRWMTGDYKSIMQDRNSEVENALGINNH